MKAQMYANSLFILVASLSSQTFPDELTYREFVSQFT